MVNQFHTNFPISNSKKSTWRFWLATIVDWISLSLHTILHYGNISIDCVEWEKLGYTNPSWTNVNSDFPFWKTFIGIDYDVLYIEQKRDHELGLKWASYGMFKFQILAELRLLIGWRNRAYNWNYRNSIFLALSLSLSKAELGSSSWTIKNTFDPLKSHQKHYKLITFDHILPM